MREVYRSITKGRWTAGRRRLGRVLLSLLPLLVAGRAVADDFVYPSPNSAVYHEFVLSAGGTIEVEVGTQITGNVHSNGTVDLRTGSTVTGNVSAVGQIVGGGTVTGTKTPGAAAVPLPAPFDEATARGLADRIVEGNATFDTDQVVNDVLFVDGDIRFRGSLNGTGTIISSGSIIFDNVTVGHPVVLDPATRLSFSATLDVTSIGKERPLRGVIVAGRDVVSDKAVDLTGVMVAGRNISVHQDSRYVKLVLDRFPPAVAITSPASSTYVNAAALRVTGTVTDDGVVAGVTVNGVAATVTGGTFTADLVLAEGKNQISVRAVDSTGKEGFAAVGVILDSRAPVVAIASPGGGRIVGEEPPAVTLTYSDAGSGVDPAIVSLLLDGQSSGTVCSAGFAAASCTLPGLQNGDHHLEARVRDRAGNAAAASLTFSFVRDRNSPSVTLTSPANGVFVNTPILHVTGEVSDDGGLEAVTVNGIAATVAGGGFTADVPLGEGANEIAVRAVDVAGRPAVAAATVVLDTQKPTLVLVAPVPGALSNQPDVRVAGVAQDASGIARVEVNGVALPVSDDRFEGTVTLADGSNPLTFRAFDIAGNQEQVVVDVRRFSLPTVHITSPAELSVIAATTVVVEGTVSAGSSVRVNGVPAVVTGGSFVATGVPLIEGGNEITATVTAADGHVGTDTIHLVRDLTAPHVEIRYPQDGARVTSAAVTVSGLVNDIVPGTVNASEAAVTINGKPATVANRSFVVTGVPLVLGDNVLTAVAVDESGNTAESSIHVRLEANVPRISIVSGDLQEGTIRSALAQPLTVSLLDANGLPVAGRPVLFKMRGGDGTLDGNRREIAVTSGLDGRASAHVTLGSRAGAGNQTVEVSAVGFRGGVFTFTANPGSPALIVVDAGDQQIGTAGQELPRPLVVAVTDAGSNRLEGVPVRFTAVKGNGRFANGLQELSVETDSDGRAVVPFTLDPQEGIVNNVVEAGIESLPDGPAAAFTASGWAAGDPAQTAVSGVVLDNTNQPVAGVTARILGTTLIAQTNAQGQFRISGAPVGTVKLIVDGSTAQRPGSWPDLEFVLTTVAGRDNTVGMPIFLLPLDLQAGVFVDETRGGTLTLEEVPGFVLEIQPGSVTFPGGSKSGLVSVTAVHSDKVPMVPNFGQQPRIIVTIQPAGARFDPPARLTLPNVDGLPPGTVTEFYSFDHDLGHFVSIGPGTVDNDGAVIVSNPGVGIVKAGWHCGGNPGGSGTTHNCPRCYLCANGRCVPDDSRGCNDNNDCTVNDRCQGGSCTGDRRRITSAQAKTDGGNPGEVYVKKDVAFTSDVQGEHCSSGDYTYNWNFGDGGTSTSANPSHKYEKPGDFTAQLQVRCRNCDSKSASVPVKVKCPKIKITSDPNISELCPGCTMQFSAETDPPGYTVNWRIADGADLGGKATISGGGLLTIAPDAPKGTVKVRASVLDDGSDCKEDRSINVFVPPTTPRNPKNGRTQGEEQWIRNHPWCAFKNMSLKKDCENEMKRVFPTPACQLDPNIGNAFLHSYCNCILAKSCGVDVTKELWDAHEEYDGNTCQYAGMDFNNNDVGRQVSSGSGSCTNLILGAMNGGRLRWMNPPPAPGECSKYQDTPTAPGGAGGGCTPPPPSGGGSGN